jgi:hypothetical protein
VIAAVIFDAIGSGSRLALCRRLGINLCLEHGHEECPLGVRNSYK